VTYRNFDGCVPGTGGSDEESKQLLKRSELTLQTVDTLLSGCHFREAMREAMSLAQEVNRYLDAKAPWKTIKEDREAAAEALSTAVGVICCLKTILYPFLPFSSERLHRLLGFDGSVAQGGWTISVPLAGQKLESPEPLFAKLDDDSRMIRRIGGVLNVALD